MLIFQKSVRYIFPLHCLQNIQHTRMKTSWKQLYLLIVWRFKTVKVKKWSLDTRFT